VWSGADAEFEPTVGADYALWDGGIVGAIVEVVPNKKLMQTWMPDSWVRQDSVVTFTLTPAGKQTQVDLLHENVEGFDYAGTVEGWDAYYLGAIKRMFETKAKKAVRVKAAKAEKVVAKEKISAKKGVGKTTKKK
jgi:activator of HSP90 ATPase